MSGQTTIQPVARAAAPPPVPLRALDVEAVRVASERTHAAWIQQHPLFAPLSSGGVAGDSKEVRRQLMAQSLRLTDSMAPEAHRVAREAQRILGITGELEIYQRSGAENAAIHLVPAPILLEIQGALLARLDGPTLLGLFGHELGHYLAHGPRSPVRDALSLTRALGRVELEPAFEWALSRLSMTAELTADRVGLLACQDLHAMLRLEMVTLTGLSSSELTWDTEAYLAQCRDLIEVGLRDGTEIHGITHPEHSLRAYALWLFSETRTYQRLTGRGPGTKDLAEVDAVIARIFGDERAASVELSLDYSRLGEPPHELHECALAAAVIVAHADGEVAEEETEAIEKIFATMVADWRSYLNLELAIERFHETAPVLAAGGRDLVRNLFHLLVHVMGADGIIDTREVEMVLAVGRVLGAEHDYRRWLAAALAALRVEATVDQAAAPDLPLPARREEVDDAFETFLRGVVRRGESSITLRRLLRLLGSERRSDELIGKVGRAFRSHGIEVSVELDKAPLDERLVLAARTSVRPPVAAPPAVEAAGSRAALVGALRRLREQLVSGDGRSPSVRLRQVRRGRAFDLMALDRVSVGMAERLLAQVRAGKAVRVIDAGDAGRHASASAVSAELLALAREDAERFEETGAHDLYVGYPFLTGNIAGYAVRAPLVLYPVELARDGAGARGYRLTPRRDEAAVANQSLIRLIFNKRGFAFSDELSDELEALAGDPDGGPEAVRRRLKEVGLVATPGGTTLQPFVDRDAELVERGAFLELEEVAVLGLFPQSSSDLLQDYDGLLHDLAPTKVDVGELLGAATALLPDRLVASAASAMPAAALDSSWAPVIAADPSQRSVIAECRRNGATVVDGPPGTGKSQVIVNLVAEALRRGERVAVVCEKRAALDVVRQRMTAIGFGKALAVVHDVYEDRKPLFAHIAERIEQKERIPFDAREAERVRAEHERVLQALDLRATALRARPAGLEMSVGELMTLAASHERIRLPAVAGLEQLPQASLRELLDITVAMQPFADLWAPGGTWRVPTGTPPRASFAKVTLAVLREVDGAIEHALAAARAYEEAERATPVGAAAVEQARPALVVAMQSRAVRREPYDQALFGALAATVASEPARLAATDEARRAWDEASAPLVRLGGPVHLEATPALLASVSVLERWARAWHRILVLGWWRARATFRRELARIWPEHAGAAITPELLQAVADRVAASRAWSTIARAFDGLGIRPLMPTHAAELAPLIGRITALAPSLRELGAARPLLMAVAAWLPAGAATPEALARWDQTLDERARLLATRDALGAAAAPLIPAFPWLDALPRSDALQALQAAWRRDATRLAEADTLQSRAGTLLPAAQALFDAVLAARGGQPATAWRSLVTAAWAGAWLERMEREHPVLGRLGLGADDREVERLATRLGELEVERRELEIERTLAQVDDAELLRIAAAEKNQRRTPEQKLREELLKEARKRRQLMPLRTFVRKFAPQGLLGVVPVWLVSPETMAILFPRQALFDLVVFDEASQCTVEAGLPVLLRARRVVIAGDEKQMPPSSYFALGATDDDEPVAENNDDARRDIRDLLTAESLLSLARPRVAHAGLAWHYRCREESLIAFSNHAMYQGDLLTIPSTSGAAGPSAMHWVSVPDGAYQTGENKREAERVVDVVDELLARQPRPTIGVVTFNLKQRKAVLDAVDARSASDPGFRDRWAEATGHDSVDERPFVKNLEQVQGDERDMIVFSLGHAPQERQRKGTTTSEKYVPARFGPLGQRGGERRLNVAISRAKAACYVVASFEPAHLTVAKSRHDGPRLFKQFLEFAHHMHHGRRVEASRVLDLVRAARLAGPASRARLPAEGFVPLTTQLGLALEAAGIPHELEIGSSSFQIPVAILDPADPTRFVLAVLVDDAHGDAGAFEIHSHRPGVLRQRGWNVLQVNAASWHRRANEIVDEIAALVPGCRGAIHNATYTRYREQRRQPPALPVVYAPTTSPRTSRASEPTPIAPVVRPPSDDVPAWAAAIDDALFRKALLHLERHGSLGEGELTSLVGGPRRARTFARELEAWREGLPFKVEVADVNGAKIYRNLGPASNKT